MYNSVRTRMASLSLVQGWPKSVESYVDRVEKNRYTLAFSGLKNSFDVSLANIRAPGVGVFCTCFSNVTDFGRKVAMYLILAKTLNYFAWRVSSETRLLDNRGETGS